MQSPSADLGFRAGYVVSTRLPYLHVEIPSPRYANKAGKTKIKVENFLFGVDNVLFRKRSGRSGKVRSNVGSTKTLQFETSQRLTLVVLYHFDHRFSHCDL
jgi:hypothetical protein